MLDISALLCSLRLALYTTLILLFCCTGMAYFLAYSRIRGKILLESLASLPLALPPTVIGFYFLMLFGRESSLGRTLADVFHIEILFSFSGLVIGSMVYSLPFMLRPLQAGFEAVSSELREIAVLNGASTFQVFRLVIMPLSWRSILTGSVLTFSHTLGEFGIVMMIGGNIPSETRTASIALYDTVQLADYQTAHLLALTLLSVCFVMNLVLFWIQKTAWKADEH